MAVALALILAVAACTPKAENQIVGKWTEGTNMTVTFTKDGKMISVEHGQTENGEYSITNGNTLCLTIKGAPMVMQMTMEFPSSKDLVLTMLIPKDLPKGMAPPKEQLSKKFTRVSE